MTQPETLRWAKRMGIDVSKKRGWRLDIILLTSGELPTDTVPALAPYFSLIVTNDLWWVSVGHERKAFSYAKWWKGRGRLHTETLAFPKPRFASIKTWMARVEKTLGVRFRRDRPFIRSNVKGGAKAVAAWLVA